MTKLILISDYDGTIKQNNIVSKSLLQLIDKFRIDKNLFGISSGRSITSLLNEVIKQDIKYDFLMGCNGTIGFDDYIIFEDVLKLIECFKDEQIDALFVSDGFDSVPIIKNIGMDQEFLNNICIKSNDVNKIIENKKIATVIIKYKDNSDRDLINNKVANISNNIEYYINMNYIDIVPRNNSKATGIEKISEMNKNGNIFVIGDDHNDISMISEYNGFAITNSPNEVLAVASKLFDNVEDCLKFIMEEKHD